MHNLTIFLLMLSLAGLTGCGEDEQSLLATPQTPPSPVSWAQVRPIIEAHCVQCHATFLEEREATLVAGEIVETVGENPMHGAGAVDPLNRSDWATLMAWAKGDRR